MKLKKPISAKVNDINGLVVNISKTKNSMKTQIDKLNKEQNQPSCLGAVMGSFSPVADSKATEALQFYEDCADNLPYYQTSEKDNGFDWDRCRAYCSVGKLYSHQRFMAYVAEWFGTTVKEMKLQWRNVK